LLEPITPQNYVWLTVTCLWANLPQILLAGLLFSLGWVPAFVLITLGFFVLALLASLLLAAPAWAALLALEAALVTEQPVSLLHFFPFWRQYWGRSVRLATLLALPIVAGWITLPLLAQPDMPWFVWLGIAANLLGVLVMGVLALYAFPLLVLYQQDLYPTLRNSLLLASRHLLNTLGVFSLGILMAFAVAYLSSALLLILPAIWGIFLVNNCCLVVGLTPE
jgi:uncharacterized membrane protein YesL